ncbi:hypothetical protein NL108_009107 [Boleophthalmus pectinirostris]|nr:hypothetical protein NL108_009107 [Boleophthalmus pectinirostris]
MASPKVLREWCRVTCAGYSSVDVKDWSSSFKSGLAFCAIIHKHRPDLIDFSSLSKDNAYQNNKMAFELAETKLGVSMLLDAGEIASASEPDRLAVITCLFQFYFLFNRKSIDLVNLKSLYVTVLNSSAKRTQDPKSLTHLESTGKYFSSDTKPQVTCNLCFKPVHLIQRQVVDGKVYHRKCFRCRHCHLSLLPGAYTAASMICSHHVKHHSENTSKQTDTCGYLSLSGLAISRVPHYSMKTEPLEEQVCKERKICSSGLYSTVKKTSAQLPASVDDENNCNDEKREAGIASEDTEKILGERGRPPVPAPRHRMSSHGTTTSPNVRTPGTQGASDKTPGSAPVATHLGSSPTRGSSQVRTNHPWLKIVHPGPWTQLPPAPPLVHPLRSKSVSSLSGVWYKTKTLAPNPFDEEISDQTTHTVEADSEFEEVTEIIDKTNDPDQSTVSASCTEDLEVQTISPTTDEAQSHSEAVIAAGSDHLEEQVPPCPPQTGNEDLTVKPESAGELPGHSPADPTPGFPLIKRKVQTDRSTSSEDLQQQIGQVAKQLEALEERGVELERDIRCCTNNKEEEKLLMDWFSLIYQRHVLQRKDAELVHLMKQQELEQRQEDVEYQLRCLLNRPEGEWSEEDRRQEQQLMEELLHIIEQRNQIISSLDQDAHRCTELYNTLCYYS